MSFNISHVFISIIYKYVQYVYRNSTRPIRTELYLILIITFIITIMELLKCICSLYIIVNNVYYRDDEITYASLN